MALPDQPRPVPRFGPPSRESEAKAKMFRVIFALAQTLRFCGTLAKLSIMISQKAIASFNMLASVRGTVADEF
jgi:hypothetical protein